MICLLYTSRASRAFEWPELTRLLAVCRDNNRSLGITGLLLYGRGRFIQVIEGPEAAVDALFRRIERDPRHDQVRLVLRQPVQSRMFAAWQMGLLTLSDDAAELDPGLSEAVDRLVALPPAGPEATRQAVVRLLRLFRQRLDAAPAA